MNILGIDPGRSKTGLAVIDENGAIQWRGVLKAERLPTKLVSVLDQWKVERIALGDSTSSQETRALLEKSFPSFPIEFVDEKNSTLEARPLYFRENPPRGWRRLIPLSLQVPPVPIDDFAAAIIARRALARGDSSG